MRKSDIIKVFSWFVDGPITDSRWITAQDKLAALAKEYGLADSAKHYRHGSNQVERLLNEYLMEIIQANQEEHGQKILAEATTNA